nr:AGE family epimerase/isomerase [Flammeovirgaceae bacterium]
MVEHSIQNLWDNDLGGLYDEGYYFEGSDTITILSKGKNWWAQAEAMNAFLLMSKLYPDEEDKFFQLFEQQWNYIKTYLIDHKNGGWYASGIDEHPEYEKRPKASIWKGTYHNARAMMECIKMLKQAE